MSDRIKMEYSFVWKIENYSFCFDKVGATLKSPIFTADNFKGSKWFLTFRPYDGDGRVMASCYLNRCKEDLGDEEIYISFTIDAMNGNGSNIINHENSGETFHRGSMHGWDEFNVTKRGWRGYYANYENENWKKDVLNIHCQIKCNLIPPESVALTEIGIDKCSFLWKLKLSDCVAASQGKNFFVSETSQYEIYVNAPDDAINIEIKGAAEHLSSPHYLHGKIILLNQEANEVSSKNAKYLFDSESGNVAWNFPSFITKGKLNNYLKNDMFSLLCKFSVANGKDSSEISSSANSFRINCNNALTLEEDFSSLFTSSKYSDVALRSDSRTFSAHKSVLAARSPVFSAMFDQDMAEKQSGIVDISDTDPETLQSFLKFVYSGTVVVKDYENAMKLLMVSEKYQMPSLKETCSIFLMSAISLGNLYEILDLIEIFNLNQLKKCALDYFAEHMKDIMVSPLWKTFSVNNPKLSMEMLSHVAENFEISPKKS